MLLLMQCSGPLCFGALAEREDFHVHKSNGSFKAAYRPKFKRILFLFSGYALLFLNARQ